MENATKETNPENVVKEEVNPMTEKMVSRTFRDLGDNKFGMLEIKEFDTIADPVEIFERLEKVKQIGYQKTMAFDKIIAMVFTAVRGYNSFVLDPRGKDAIESKRQVLEAKSNIDHILVKIPTKIEEILDTIEVYNNDMQLMRDAKAALGLTYDVPGSMDAEELLSNINRTITPAPEWEELVLDVNKAKEAWSKLAGDIEVPPFLSEEEILGRLKLTANDQLNEQIEDRRIEKMKELEAAQKRNHVEKNIAEEKNPAEEVAAEQKAIVIGDTVLGGKCNPEGELLEEDSWPEVVVVHTEPTCEGGNTYFKDADGILYVYNWPISETDDLKGESEVVEDFNPEVAE